MTTVPVVGRAGLSDRLVDMYRTGNGLGATLVGPAGIGKTALARHVVEQLGSEFDPAWITGTAAAADIPLAAFSSFLPPSGTDPGLPAMVHIRDAVAATTNGRRRLLVVDDAHALDETSAALVHQFAMHGISLLLTQRSGAVASDAVTRLWRDRILERIDVEPIGPDAVGLLTSGVLNGDIDASSIHEVWRRSSGNPLFARELVIASHAAGEWSRTATGWRWTVGDAETPRLTDLLRDRLERLSPAQREALVHLAFGEPMGLGEFAAICSDDVLESLESDGLIIAGVDRRRISIRFTHPLHADVIRRTTSPLRARVVRSQLVAGLRATGARRRDDMMRMATLAIDAGSDLDREHLLTAARAALSVADRSMTTRLAREAFDRFPGFETGHVLADALYEEGNFSDIERHWGAWVDMAADETQRGFVALHQANSYFYRAGDGPAALAVLDAAGAAIASGPKRDEIVALSATLQLLSGRMTMARSIAEPLLGSTDRRVEIQAALTTVHAMRAGGSTEDALALARHAIAAHDLLGPAESLVTRTVFGTSEAWVLLAAGRFGDALRSADAAFESAQQAGDASAQGLSQLSRSEALLISGRFLDAMQAARLSESSFASNNHRGFQRWASAQRAYIAATAGDADGFVRSSADLVALGPHPAALFEYVAVLSRVVDEYTADPAGTADTALRTARTCVELGDRHAGIRCVYELVRCGDSAGVDLLVGWAEESDAALHRAMSAHGRAMVDDDGDALADVAEDFARMDAIVYAMRAAEHAVAAFERAGDRRRATRLAIMSSTWRGRCQPLVARAPLPSPGAVVTVASTSSGPDPDPVQPLTRREREIALLAAQGLASRAVADRLFLSPRTVENHLARAYSKLGVASRAELAHALAVA